MLNLTIILLCGALYASTMYAMNGNSECNVYAFVTLVICQSSNEIQQK